MIILIDNYDSFTWNLVQYFGELGAPVDVYRNDKITVDEVLAKKPEAVILSPGPATPNEAGICLDMVAAAAREKLPLFGVCLGHQTIGQAFDGRIDRVDPPMHGKLSDIRHHELGIFNGLPQDFDATRYHSLVVAADSIPDDLVVTAETADGLVMGLHHRDLPIHGVQFHPESIRSEHGHQMIRNFLSLAGIETKDAA